MRTTSLFLPLALALGCDLAAQAWTLLTPPPYPNTTLRRTGGMAYHPVAGGLVMYGGLHTAINNTTWLFAAGTWTQLAPATTPPLRWGHKMVYDSRRNRIVTFGGRSPSTTVTANDTWEFDGTDWAQVFPTASPNARAFYGMAYDERRGKTIVYGTQSGSTIGTSGGNQTWEYDGTTWAQVITAFVPPGLESPALVYDKGRGVTVMFGGFNGTPPGTDYRTTWEYDGIDWVVKPTVNAPLTGYRTGIVYDDARGRVVLYGGYASATVQQKTWEYDGNDWTLVLAGAGPGRITEGYMGYDPVANTTVYFGGSGPTVVGTVNNETWLFTGVTNAIAGPYGRTCPTSAGTPTLAASTLPVLGTNYNLTVTSGLPLTVAVMIHGTDNLAFAPSIYLPLDLTIAGIPGCWLETRPDVLLTEVGAGPIVHTLAIPNSLGLLGAPLFTQTLVLDGAAPNGFGGMTNAMHAVLGL